MRDATRSRHCVSVVTCSIMVPLLIFSFVIASALAAPQDPKQIAILKNEVDVRPDGYQYAYETENGIKGEESAQIKETGPEEADKTAQGAFSWTAPEGEKVEITYIADANGYQPQGAAIPTPPPIPPEIQKSLEYNAAHPEQDDSQGKQ